MQKVFSVNKFCPHRNRKAVNVTSLLKPKEDTSIPKSHHPDSWENERKYNIRLSMSQTAVFQTVIQNALNAFKERE